MATLHLMVGLPCSGKTTLARKLEYACSALRLTPDEWQLRLFGQDAEEPEHNARHTLIETLQGESGFLTVYSLRQSRPSGLRRTVIVR